jgi:hypothetical protein
MTAVIGSHSLSFIVNTQRLGFTRFQISSNSHYRESRYNPPLV